MSRMDMTEEEDTTQDRFFARFDKYHEFVDSQNEFLASLEEGSATSDAESSQLLRKLTFILDQYQEQSYLLDPYLEELVSPGVAMLKRRVQENKHGLTFFDREGANIWRLSSLLYHYIKFRGYKTITRFFPHEIADLSIVLEYMLLPTGFPQDSHLWALRYVMLLWLSLICMLPFDLAQFDEDEDEGKRGETKTAVKIEQVAMAHLDKAGIERDGAAILLAKLYMRKDMHDRFPSFIQRCRTVIESASNICDAIGSLRALCEITKSGTSTLIDSNRASLLQICHTIPNQKALASNTLVRKLRSKLLSRVVLRLLPGRTRNRKRGRALVPSAGDETGSAMDPDLDMDVPEETETALEELFQSLQDKDTIVRYSSAKGIARIADRLSSDFISQILDNILQLFSLHSLAAGRNYEIPAIAEATWHGACLACAELARRGLVPDDKLGELMAWLSKALSFDILQGSHSIGSSVRDATAYVLWSLARAQSPSALEPFAQDLAQKLITVACFDREVSIRRAASAAFQEYVGRTGLFPHGIDVLRKSDFYAVGTRRHAFLVAAPEIAEHIEYRPSLITHLLTVTIRHWDVSMREMGAKSLREIAKYDLVGIVGGSVSRIGEYLTFPDAGDVHGALLTLTELARACTDAITTTDATNTTTAKPAPPNIITELTSLRKRIFTHLSKIPPSMVQSPRHELVTAAACELIAACVSLDDIRAQRARGGGNATGTPESSSENSTSEFQWRKILDFAFKSRSVMVQEAAADAIGAISKLAECSHVMQRLMHDAKPTSPASQQSVCRVLGVLDYNSHPHGIVQAVEYLLGAVDKKAPTFMQNIEARRNAYIAMPLIIANVLPTLPQQLSPTLVRKILSSLQAGLEDYTIDERGDVGSWIRITCIKSLTDIAILFLTNPSASQLPNFVEYFPPDVYHEAIGGILKQGVERLDNVRQQAGIQIVRILKMSVPDVPGFDGDAYRVDGEELMRRLFLDGENETTSWNEGAWLYSKAVQLLAIKEYRGPLLAGFVLSASSRTDSTQRPVSASLVKYAQSLPVSADEDNSPYSYTLRELIRDIITPATRNLGSNTVVIPALHTINVLLGEDALEGLYEDNIGLKSLQTVLSISTKNITKIKNVQRILTSMRVVVNLLPASKLRTQCAEELPDFLAHQYPKIRSDTAEYLYTVLQSKDLGIETDEAEEILLETEWSSEDMGAVKEAAVRCAKLLGEVEE
ncbi:TBCD protein [Panus rudis PR-1116 ss-1]|nr:TBCD protein [Panus rudis PR-1116 ss-1]